MFSPTKLQKTFKWTHVLPEEVWIDVLKRLRLTDLALVSQTCKTLSRMTRLSIRRYHRHDSPFTSSNEFSHDGVPIEPDIHPESGQAICFDEFANTLKLLHLPTGTVKACSPETSNFPVSVKFSNTGKFVVALFDSSIIFYALDVNKEKLIPCRDITFNVRIRDFVPPGYGRCRYGMGRMLVSFSRNDKKLAVAHIFETLGSNSFVTFRCLTTTIHDDDFVENSTIDYERLRRSTNPQEKATIRLKIDREFVAFWDIHMNADPLRFLIPPGCLDESGYLLDPKRTESPLCLHIKDFDETLGNLISQRFSACGRYYFETRIIPRHMALHLTITKFELASGVAVKMTDVSMTDFSTIIGVLISKDSMLAVILLGCIANEVAQLTGWYVVNLFGEGYLYVRCKMPVYTTQNENLDRTFDLSDDGQLLSISCHVEDGKGYYMVKVYETATGFDIDALTCAVPSGGDILQSDWHGIGRCACYHVFGGRHRSTLTMFTTCDTGVSFSHAS